MDPTGLETTTIVNGQDHGWEGEPVVPLSVGEGPPMDSEYGTADDLLRTTVPLSQLWIPEVGKTFLVRAISGKERDAYEQSMIVGRGANMHMNQRNARAKLAVLALSRPDGTRLFRDEDVAKVGNLPGIVLERIFDRARKLAGLTTEDMDELLGNSDGAPSGASTTG